MKNSSEIKFVPKGWGYERWLVNNEKYCGKILWFAKGKRCSYHYHLIKEETFFCASGKVLVVYGPECPLNTKLYEVTLVKGDTFHVLPKLRHQIIALEDSEIYEFSTHHEDSDSYRIEKGD